MGGVLRRCADLYPGVLVFVAVAFLLFQVYAYLRKKSSKAVDFSASSNPYRSSAHLLVAITAVVLASFVWMERYKFDHMTLETGESYPVKISRLTGDGEVLYRGTWKPADEIRTLPSLLKELHQEDLAKLTGDVKLDNSGVFYLDLYNGSDFALKEITVEFVVRDSHQEEVLRRSYRYPHEHPSKRIEHYIEEVDFAIGPQQSWSWKIVGAKGIRD